MNVVILAGGSGTRLWPMSRRLQPKQLAKLVSDVTMIEDTVNRLNGFANWDQTYISTNENFAPLIKELLPRVPFDHYIVEPERRDTGPAMAFAAAWLAVESPNEPMILMPSDHHINDAAMFRDVLKVTETLIREQGTMVNFGIAPTFPNVNLGYLKIGKFLEDRDGVHIHEFGGQKEKPDYKTAKKFLTAGNYLWNAGYFAWTPAKFIAAYKKFAPGIGDHLDELGQAIKLKDRAALTEVYGKMEAKSIDYAVIEKMNPAAVRTIRGDFGWADLGSWDMLYDQLGHQTDEQGNLVKGNWHGLDTTNSLIYAPEGKLVTTIGLSDMVIVDTPEALLITPKGRAPEVKKIVDLLKKRNLEDHL
ncbi:mannose-1-phosphate guanylyltransferase [Candidatus Berkelbacteria bacterium]|nr:mannose-1-phosphate guanylyltransferase [Candidatus Berkelbacteria bacterium]